MPGETDLGTMLRDLRVSRRPGVYSIVTVEEPPVFDDDIEALIREAEAVTVVCRIEVAEAAGWDAHFRAAWLTIEVHSALEAAGLTAAFSRVLADAGIACNVVAGYFHDHLLVPHERADEAIEVLEGLRRSGAGAPDQPA